MPRSSTNPPPAQRRQRGIALVTALLLVALATTAAVEMVSRQHLDIRRVQNVLAYEQAYSYAVAAEQWALHQLQESFRHSPERDHLAQDWALPVILPEFDGARLGMQIQDAQARFNVNNLADVQPGDTDNIYLQQFLRLLEQQGADDPVALANAVMDWLDPDLEERPGGAEDSTYTQKERPYRAANQPIADISELRLVQGMTPELYRELEPHLSALPERTHININTASAVLLRTIHPMDEPTAAHLVEQRPDEGFANVNEMLALIPGAGDSISEQGMGVTSGHFQAAITVELGPVRVQLLSLIRREQTGALRVLARSQGAL